MNRRSAVVRFLCAAALLLPSGSLLAQVAPLPETPALDAAPIETPLDDASALGARFDLSAAEPTLAPLAGFDGESLAALPRESAAARPLFAAPSRREASTPPTASRRPLATSVRKAVAAAIRAIAPLAASALLLDVSCGPTPPTNQTWTHPNGSVSVQVSVNPFSMVFKDASGKVLLESAQALAGTDPADPVRANAPLSTTQDLDVSPPPIGGIWGWDDYAGIDNPWAQSAQVTSIQNSAAALVFDVATDQGGGVTVRIEAQGPGIHLTATPDGDPGDGLNRVSMAFAMHPDDHFFGFGERFVYSDHRGQKMTNWVEEDGFGLGPNTPVGIGNPFPNGPSQAHLPIPWFLSPRGYGLLLNGSYRTVHHLGDETSGAWRVESWQRLLDATLFADPDPAKLVEDLTGITGRPPEIADWVLAPRRRADTFDEALKLRAAGVPTSVIDFDTHYFPNGAGSDSAAMQALTAEAHQKGFEAVAYFNSFIETTWTSVFNEASAKGYLVKHADGTPYLALDPNNYAGIVDFTNPDAVTWYQGWLKRALDDGWDGWMYDFGEYIPRDAVMFNGMSGMQAHNLYPVLYQKAAYDLLQTLRPKNYLLFARSGFNGTGGVVPMVWAGDQNTDFDQADGLPAALMGALNAGMSGIPLWGSDISGYHFIFNPPPNKELYLRWTEVGAFSADMHDENNGQGLPGSTASERWNIWSDQETLSTYANYASWKTRMVPYVKLAVAQAQKTGLPVMRHLYLNYPKDPNVYGLTDEYMYGDSLLVAPVVQPGLTSRPVYLPEPAYFDFWSGQRVAGGGTILADAPLDSVPVYAKLGAIVPLLSPDVQTLVPSTDGSVVSAADRSGFMEVAVFAGGSTSVTLDDGTTLAQSAPMTPFTPADPAYSKGPIPVTTNAADLKTCAACAYDDAANNVWSVAINTSGDTITAGPLTLTVANSPTPKRFLFTVRH